MTKVRFLIDSSGNVFAYFPTMFKRYRKGRFTPVRSNVDEYKKATPSQYMPLLAELQSIGYDRLHVL